MCLSLRLVVKIIDERRGIAGVCEIRILNSWQLDRVTELADVIYM